VLVVIQSKAILETTNLSVEPGMTYCLATRVETIFRQELGMMLSAATVA
jgi:hypothetical protein